MTERLSADHTPNNVDQAFRYLDNLHVGDEEAPESTAGDTIYQAACNGEVPSLPVKANVKVGGKTQTIICPKARKVITPDGNSIYYFPKPTS